MSWLDRLLGKNAGAVDSVGPSLRDDLRDPRRREVSPVRAQRQEDRENIYLVVRECMTQAGILSARYRFKVLSMGSKNVEYVVMVDLPKESLIDSVKLKKIEGLICSNTLHRFGIHVTAVYWRVLEVEAPNESKKVIRLEPLMNDEITAFQRARESHGLPPAPILESPVPRRFSSDVDSPLSATQFGGLS